MENNLFSGKKVEISGMLPVKDGELTSAFDLPSLLSLIKMRGIFGCWFVGVFVVVVVLRHKPTRTKKNGSQKILETKTS